MKINRETLNHLEALARIELTDDERERMIEQLRGIVEYVEQLQDVDTTDVEPTSSVIQEAGSKLRSDEPRPGLDRDTILAEAPDTKNGFFRVPKIIDR